MFVVIRGETLSHVRVLSHRRDSRRTDDSAREFISGAGERTSASAAAAAETTAAAAAKAVAETADANAHAGRAAAEQTTTRYKWILRVA